MSLGSFATMDKWAVHRKPSAEAPVNEDVYTEMLGENTEGVFWMQMTEITTVDDFWLLKSLIRLFKRNDIDYRHLRNNWPGSFW